MVTNKFDRYGLINNDSGNNDDGIGDNPNDFLDLFPDLDLPPELLDSLPDSIVPEDTPIDPLDLIDPDLPPTEESHTCKGFLTEETEEMCVYVGVCQLDSGEGQPWRGERTESKDLLECGDDCPPYITWNDNSF